MIKPETIVEEVEINGPFRRKRLFEVFMKYVAPIFIILILISSIANSLGWIVI